MLLDALLTPPTSQSDAARHFYDAARAIIGGFMGWVRFGPGMEGGTLELVRSLLLSPKDEAKQLAEVMGKFPDVAFGRVAEALQRMERVGAQEAGSNFSTIANQLGWLRFPELQEDTLESDFDVRGICDGNTDLYVVVPPALLEEVRAWIRLWISVPNAIASEHIGAERKDLLIVLDEMPKLGYLAPVMSAWTMAAGTGVHFWAIIQSLSALEASWGSGTPNCSWTTRNSTRSWASRTPRPGKRIVSPRHLERQPFELLPRASPARAEERRMWCGSGWCRCRNSCPWTPTRSTSWSRRGAWNGTRCGSHTRATGSAVASRAPASIPTRCGRSECGMGTVQTRYAPSQPAHAAAPVSVHIA